MQHPDANQRPGGRSDHPTALERQHTQGGSPIEEREPQPAAKIVTERDKPTTVASNSDKEPNKVQSVNKNITVIVTVMISRIGLK